MAVGGADVAIGAGVMVGGRGSGVAVGTGCATAKSDSTEDVSSLGWQPLKSKKMIVIRATTRFVANTAGIIATSAEIGFQNDRMIR